jgi:hypothetical protein
MIAKSTLTGMVICWLAYAAIVAVATSFVAYWFMRAGWF